MAKRNVKIRLRWIRVRPLLLPSVLAVSRPLRRRDGRGDGRRDISGETHKPSRAMPKTIHGTATIMSAPVICHLS